ncbi:thymidine phosphorylase [Psychrobacillus lasiicapitis]|uniref:Pyrimidine-nucleoside phosphorylase n=1 Tax=Psychrobacillus lasiicapitis TaxID=1636719 RepID=A0A544THV7_9BACI|nr:thymidine phosphorylase [Psychrobacillus lasiicapitis]TQR17011.1 thymidine phosphorylase [Psychrobacillus lasiicapitis]GGA25279.1 pyrimidine-nucleoside phosphorylase [Psychrobacillus lasiicapitis]
MNMLELIDKKKRNNSLTEEEINYMITKYTKDEVPDYQMSSMLMAILINGMDENETAWLTKAMVESGDVIDLSSIEGFKVDKHSTGGIGDKVSLLVAPILASLDIPIAKMSGRGLGITGGTVDKLESIDGFHVELEADEFIKQVNEHKIAIVGQSGNLTPADKKLYALRDVTGTVDSIPLIASSIMSKKIASGADGIVLDVKCGKGAFMKDLEHASELAKTMIQIGESLGRKVAVVITDMNQPLGHNIGNKLEVAEAYDFLSDYKTSEQGLLDVTIAISSKMYQLATDVSDEVAEQKVLETLSKGAALAKLEEFITAQGGDASDVHAKTTKHEIEVKAAKDGYISLIDAELIGKASLLVGAGRLTKADVLDFDAGVKLVALNGQSVKKGDTLAVLYSNKDAVEESVRLIEEAYSISDAQPVKNQSILKIM